MKNKSLVTWLGTGALALSFAVLPSTLPASAQTDTDPATTDPAAPVDTVVTTDDGFDWGWLGLLGLLGLAGLKGRDHDRATHVERTVTTPTTPTTPTNNPR